VSCNACAEHNLQMIPATLLTSTPAAAAAAAAAAAVAAAGQPQQPSQSTILLQGSALQCCLH
jgi:hypothetical protein